MNEIDHVNAHRREKGVALVLAMGIVALVSAIAVTSVDEDFISIRKGENRGDFGNVWLGVASGFELAKQKLYEDLQESENDSLNEVWSQKTAPFSVSGGSIHTQIEDANRFYNLNDLINVSGKASLKEIALCKRIFSRVGVPTNLVDAIVDWMDTDDSIFGSGGAEESSYLNNKYRIKNSPLDRFEELKLVKGMTSEYFEALRTVAIVRPSMTGGRVEVININTATKEVLLSLLDSAPQGTVESIIAEREDRPYTKVADAITDVKWLGGLDITRVSVASDVFIIKSGAKFGRVVWVDEFMVERSKKALYTLYREKLSWKQQFFPTKEGLLE